MAPQHLLPTSLPHPCKLSFHHSYTLPIPTFSYILYMHSSQFSLTLNYLPNPLCSLICLNSYSFTLSVSYLSPPFLPSGITLLPQSSVTSYPLTIYITMSLFFFSPTFRKLYMLSQASRHYTLLSAPLPFILFPSFTPTTHPHHNLYHDHCTLPLLFSFPPSHLLSFIFLFFFLSF